MPARQPVKTLSYGYSISHITEHISRRQRKSRLANLRRLRPNPYIHCQRSLRQGRLRHQSSSRSVRSRLNNYRFMPVSISLGTISQNQSGHQTSYITQLTRQYSRVYPYFRRKTTRCQCSRHSDCQPGSFYLMDRGYVDFARLHTIQQASAFFVTRCQRCKDASLDSCLRLCTCSDSQKKARTRPKPLHNSTVFKCVDFRENTYFRSVFARVQQN